MENKNSHLESLGKEFLNLAKGRHIENPEMLIELRPLPKDIKKIIHVKNAGVGITRKVIKHITEQRGQDALYILRSIPDILARPSKIAKNNSKRPNSFLFAKMNGRAKAIILELQNNHECSLIVSAFLMDKKTFKKLVDISGRSDVPSSG